MTLRDSNNIKVGRLCLRIILFYSIITFILSLCFINEIIAFIPIKYHISHAIFIGCFTLFSCYTGIVAEEKTKFFATIGIFLLSTLTSFVCIEGILKFSTLFLNKEKPLVECVEIVNTSFRSKTRVFYQANIKMSDDLVLPVNYNITSKEKHFIDSHISACTCIELSFFKSPLGFHYTKFGSGRGVVKVCEDDVP